MCLVFFAFCPCCSSPPASKRPPVPNGVGTHGQTLPPHDCDRLRRPHPGAGLRGGAEVAPGRRHEDHPGPARRERPAPRPDVGLRGENRDLSERAVGDARKIAALEGANERLETSVQGYIDEREDLVDKFQRYRRLAQAATGGDLSAGLSARLRAFASAHPGTTFDEAAGALSAATDTLFAPGGDRLSPAGSRWVDDMATLVASPEAKSVPVAITGLAGDPSVRLTSTAAPRATRPWPAPCGSATPWPSAPASTPRGSASPAAPAPAGPASRSPSPPTELATPRTRTAHGAADLVRCNVAPAWL